MHAGVSNISRRSISRSKFVLSDRSSLNRSIFVFVVYTLARIRPSDRRRNYTDGIILKGFCFCNTGAYASSVRVRGGWVWVSVLSFVREDNKGPIATKRETECYVRYEIKNYTGYGGAAE